MLFDSLSESAVFEFAQFANPTSARERDIDKLSGHRTIPISANTHRLDNRKRPSAVAIRQLINNQKSSFTVDRIAYKLRMKSDLNVDTIREKPVRPIRTQDSLRYKSQNNSNSNIHEASNPVPSSATTRSHRRQPTAVTMATNSKKTVVNDEINGIEGSAVHVGTLDDLIKQSHQEEFRIYNRAAEFLDSAAAFLQSNRLLGERVSSKPTLFSAERIVKQPQPLTVFHFHAPIISRTSAHTNQNRMKEKTNNIDFPLITHQYNHRSNSLERQQTAISSRFKRIQESRAKILTHTEKQICNCSKLTIRDPFNYEQSTTMSPLVNQFSARYIFPPVRPFGYFTRKSLENIPSATSSSKNRRYVTSKRQPITKGSFESLNQGISDDDENSPFFNDTIKSMVSLSDADENSQSLPSPRVNFDLKVNKH